MRMPHTFTLLPLAAVLIAAGPLAAPASKALVAHRGASGYAPEHTLASYRLAMAQGADFVEQDLAVTKDGVLICLHDPSLERTTNVEELFPDRFTEITYQGRTRKAWLANDFTLAEIKTLDAGSWFKPEFAGQRVPTFDEAVTLIKGHAGLYPELKTPEIYEGRDVRFEALVATALDAHRLRGPGADPKTPVILQTFGEGSARKLLEMKIGVPVVLLVSSGTGWDAPARFAQWKRLGLEGLGPAKQILLQQPDFVRLAHDAGLTVTPYTFRTGDTGEFASVREEMAHYLYDLGVDALFTDNPDQFPRR
ncbi:MAG: glycerophosphodiester phosphodiesterase family protein [Vicinamibacterales bacterium]